MPKKTTKKTAKKSPAVRKPAAKKAAKKPAKKRVQPVVLPTFAPPPAMVAPPSQADQIWNEIQNLPIQMFGLPGQIVAMHVIPVSVEPSKLYLTIRSSAALPSLEAAIAPKFVVELADRFIIVTRAPQPLVPSRQR